jgi:WD40 repeat protein
MRFQERFACCVIVLVILGLSSLWPVYAVLPPDQKLTYSIAWKPDGTEFATGYNDGTVTVWDATTQQPVLTFEVAPELHDPPVVYSLAWSPDGNTLAAAASAGGGMIKVFNPMTGASLAEFRAETFTGTVAWSPDGSKLAGGATRGLGFIAEGWVKVWDVATGQVVAELLNGTGDTSNVSDISWSADGSRLACASLNWAVIWDTSTWETVFRLEHPNVIRLDNFGLDNFGQEGPNVVSAVAWSPQGSRLATGDVGTIRIWDGVSGELLSTFHTGHDLIPVYRLAWSPSGTQLASVSAGVQIWDVATGQLLEEISGHINDAAWNPDGSQLAYGGGDGILELIDGPTQAPRDITAIAWSPDGTEFATGQEGGTVTIWDAATQQPLLTFEVAPEMQPHPPVVYSLAWSPDGNKLAVAASAGGGVIKVFDPTTGASLAEFRAETFTGTVVWSPDGSKLAGGTTKGLGSIAEGWVKVWDVATGQVVAELLNGSGDTSSVWQVSWNADGSRLVCSSNNRAVIWDSTTWETVLELEHPSVVLPATWSPQGSQLATGDESGTIRIWDGVSGQLLSTIQTGYDSEVEKLAWSPSRTQLAAIVAGELQIWDVAVGQILIDIPSYIINDVAWSPDGIRLVYVGANGLLESIDAPTTPIGP